MPSAPIPSKKRFRVAFSFSGDKRPFVAKLARRLAERFGETAILYDKHYEAEFAHAHLGLDLPDLYHKQSDLVVVVFSDDYEKKEWCGLEWTAIHALLKENRGKDVMLCRFDRTIVKGLFTTAGYVELDHKTPAEAVVLILERLAHNEGLAKEHYVLSPAAKAASRLSSVPPNNLPRPSCFFGREAELKRIAEALNPKRRGWGALIYGPGGMGKTSLVIQAALAIPPGAFNRIVFVSAKQSEMTANGPRKLLDFVRPTCDQMLNDIIRLHGLVNLAGKHRAQRMNRLTEALANERTLFVVDNLEALSNADVERMFTFIGRLPQQCKALVTSRPRYPDDGCSIDLRELKKAPAMKYLVELAANQPILKRSSLGQRERLYEETGGNPLLIRWVVGQLGRGSCTTIAHAIKYLKARPEGNDPLSYIFDDMATGLSRSEKKAIQSLGKTYAPTDIRGLARQAGLTITTATTVLNDLVERGLVNTDAVHEMYSVLPIVVAYLEERKPCPKTLNKT